MPPKRAHVFKRSFVGCWTCRRRKVKCDATRPACNRCIRSRIQCEGYDIKLNWTSNLVVDEQGEMSLHEESRSDGDVEGISRSRIELVQWWLYDTYDAIDTDLDKLETMSMGQVGPFRVFTTAARSTNVSTSGIMRAPSLSHSVSTATTTTESLRTIIVPPTPRDDHAIKTFTEITMRTLQWNITIDITPMDVINNTQLINRFIETIPSIFDKDIEQQLTSTITTTMGHYILTESPMDLILLLSIATITMLYSATTTDLTMVNTAISYRFKIHSMFNEQQDDPASINHEQLALILSLMIMINTTLGVYDPQLFKFIPRDHTVMSQYFTFFQATNILINHSQFQFSLKFQRIYADLLDPHYNLLRNFIARRQRSKPLGNISIQASDTPTDKIIKVPRHQELEDGGADEPPPPTFTIHFSNEKGADFSNSLDSDQDLDANSDDDGDVDVVVDDDVDDDDEDEQTAMFDIDMDDTTTSIYGISTPLVHLYEETCQIINHKRSFVSMQMNSRNFAKVCAEFEDLLIRKTPNACHSKEDQMWYHMLLILYFCCVKNYPKSRLRFHYNKLKHYDDDTPACCFINTLIQPTTTRRGNECRVWLNNWRIKQWTYAHQGKDWIYDEDKPANVFVL